MALIKGEGSSRIVTGRVIKDAEYRLAGSKQTPMTTFAVSYGRNAQNGGILNVTCFKQLADYCKDIKKGDSVLVGGSLESSEYNGKTYWKLMADYASVVDVIPVSVDKPDSWGELKTEDIPF